MKKLMTLVFAMLFAASTGVFAGAHMKGEKDAPKAEKSDKKMEKTDKSAKKDDKAKK